MKRLLPRTLLASAALLTLGLVGASGCADNRSTLYVVGVLAPPTGSDCGVAYDPGQPRIGRGTMDVFFTDQYSPHLLVGNQMVPQGNNDQLRSETSRIDLREAVVSLSRPGQGTFEEFTTNISGSANPAPSPAPGYAGAEVTLVPAGLNLALGEYLATVRIFGETLGGQDVETGEFKFPFIVCNGCTISGLNRDGICTSVGTPDRPCTPGEDSPYDCALLSDL